MACYSHKEKILFAICSRTKAGMSTICQGFLNLCERSDFLRNGDPTIQETESNSTELFQICAEPRQGAGVLTQGLLELALVGMFEDEEVVSGRIFGNPTGKLLRLCRFGVNQLNGLFLYIQPL